MKNIIIGISVIGCLGLSFAAVQAWAAGAVGGTDSVTNAIAVAATPNWINSPPTNVAAPKTVAAPSRTVAVADTTQSRSTRAIASESVDILPGTESGNIQNQILKRDPETE